MFCTEGVASINCTPCPDHGICENNILVCFNIILNKRFVISDISEKIKNVR